MNPSALSAPARPQRFLLACYGIGALSRVPSSAAHGGLLGAVSPRTSHHLPRAASSASWYRLQLVHSRCSLNAQADLSLLLLLDASAPAHETFTVRLPLSVPNSRRMGSRAGADPRPLRDVPLERLDPACLVPAQLTCHLASAQPGDLCETELLTTVGGYLGSTCGKDSEGLSIYLSIYLVLNVSSLSLDVSFVAET